jgi:hypothetical protein
MGVFRKLTSIALDHVDLEKMSLRPVLDVRGLDISPSKYGLINLDEVQGMGMVVLDGGKPTGYIVLAIES